MRAHGSPDLVSALEQFPAQRAPDKAACSGNQYFFISWQ